MKTLLATNSSPLSYSRVPFENYKDTTPKDNPVSWPARQGMKAGTVIGAPSYKKGGTVKKTGLALVHKGEKVIPKNKVEKKKKDLASKCR